MSSEKVYKLTLLALVLIGLVSLLSVVILHVLPGTPAQEYGIVVDAGSSHSSITVYTWSGRKHMTGMVGQYLPICNAEKSLSSYANDPSGASESLMPCLDSVLSQIPSHRHNATSLYIAATAGMRLLELINSVIKAMIALPVQLKNVSIIEGTEEGVNGWITINYISNRFMDKNHQHRPYTIGALDMGGASTQIVYEVNSSTQYYDAVQSLKLYGETYRLLVRSYLCCGFIEMTRMYRARLAQADLSNSNVSDPCLAKGQQATVTSEELFLAPCVRSPMASLRSAYTFHGAVNLTECHAVIKELIESSSECTIRNATAVRDKKEFYAFSGFYYVAKYFSCESNCSFENFWANVDAICQRGVEATNRIQVPAEILKTMCMRAVYTLILFKDVYRFDSPTFESIQFVNEVESTDIGWSLGQMLRATNQLPEEKPEERIGILPFSIVITASICFLIFGIVLLTCVICIKRRRYGIFKKASSLHDYSSKE